MLHLLRGRSPGTKNPPHRQDPCAAAVVWTQRLAGRRTPPQAVFSAVDDPVHGFDQRVGVSALVGGDDHDHAAVAAADAGAGPNFNYNTRHNNLSSKNLHKFILIYFPKFVTLHKNNFRHIAQK